MSCDGISDRLYRYLNKALMSDDFPAPVLPTMPTFSFDCTSNERSLRTGGSEVV